MMDTSLARGLKNQLFREISEEVEHITERWIRFTKASKLQISRGRWEKYCEGIESALQSFFLAKYSGGSKRKPFICFATFENIAAADTLWGEKAIASRYMLVSKNPLTIEVKSSGFVVGEHAIFRIFQRAFDVTEITSESFKKIYFSKELQYIPLWYLFWIYHGLTKLADVDSGAIKIVIPSQTGLLLGRLRKNEPCEIRTYVSRRQFSEFQELLYKFMTATSMKYLNSGFPFICFDRVSESPSCIQEYEQFLNDTLGLADAIEREDKSFFLGDQSEEGNKQL